MEAVEEACLRAAADEGVTGDANAAVVRVRAALDSDLMQRAVASRCRWCELYLAAPFDTDGVRLIQGFAELVRRAPGQTVVARRNLHLPGRRANFFGV